MNIHAKTAEFTQEQADAVAGGSELVKLTGA
jgi:hypothetical protein